VAKTVLKLKRSFSLRHSPLLACVSHDLACFQGAVPERCTPFRIIAKCLTVIEHCATC